LELLRPSTLFLLFLLKLALNFPYSTLTPLLKFHLHPIHTVYRDFIITRINYINIFIITIVVLRFIYVFHHLIILAVIFLASFFHFSQSFFTRCFKFPSGFSYFTCTVNFFFHFQMNCKFFDFYDVIFLLHIPCFYFIITLVVSVYYTLTFKSSRSFSNNMSTCLYNTNLFFLYVLNS